MTLYISPTLASTLSTAGTSNNPFFAHVNLADQASSIAGVPTAATGGDPENATEGNTYDYWIPDITGTTATLTLTFGSAVNCSFVGVASHNLGTIGAEIKVQHSADGSTWTDADGVNNQAPTTDATLGFMFTQTSAAYWRIRLANLTAGTDPNIGVVLFSRYLQMPQRVYQGFRPFMTPSEVAVVPEITEGGHFKGSTVVRRGSRGSVEFTEIAPSFLRTQTWRNFQKAWNNGKPAFFHWRPTKYKDDPDLHYVMRDGDPVAPTNSGPRAYMSATFNMRAYHEDW